MKKLAYLIIIVFALASLTSCGSKKKACGMTSDVSQVVNQEVAIAE